MVKLIKFNAKLFLSCNFLFQFFYTIFTNVAISSVALFWGALILRIALTIIELIALFVGVQYMYSCLDISDVELRLQLLKLSGKKKDYLSCITKTRKLKRYCLFFLPLIIGISIATSMFVMDTKNYHVSSKYYNFSSEYFPNFTTVNFSSTNISQINEYYQPTNATSYIPLLFNSTNWLLNSFFGYLVIQLSNWNLYQQDVQINSFEVTYKSLLIIEIILYVLMLICLFLVNHSVKIEKDSKDFENLEIAEICTLLLSKHSASFIKNLKKNNFEIQFL